MFNCFSGQWLCVCLIGIAASNQVVASPEVPPPEFWDYVSEFGTDSGELVDPIELDQMLRLQKSEAAEIKEESDAPLNVRTFTSATKKASDQHSSTNLAPQVPEEQLK